MSQFNFKLRMLTQMELKILNYIYSVMCNKIYLIPIIWRNGRFGLNSKRKKFCNAVICFFIVSELVFRLEKLSVYIGQRDIDAAILQIFFTIKPSYHLVFRGCTWLFNQELIRIISVFGC